jgi:hypothetical protein
MKPFEKMNKFTVELSDHTIEKLLETFTHSSQPQERVNRDSGPPVFVPTVPECPYTRGNVRSNKCPYSRENIRSNRCPYSRENIRSNRCPYTQENPTKRKRSSNLKDEDFVLENLLFEKLMSGNESNKKAVKPVNRSRGQRFPRKPYCNARKSCSKLQEDSLNDLFGEDGEYEIVFFDEEFLVRKIEEPLQKVEEPQKVEESLNVEANSQSFYTLLVEFFNKLATNPENSADLFRALMVKDLTLEEVLLRSLARAFNVDPELTTFIYKQYANVVNSWGDCEDSKENVEPPTTQDQLVSSENTETKEDVDLPPTQNQPVLSENGETKVPEQQETVVETNSSEEQNSNENVEKKETESNPKLCNAMTNLVRQLADNDQLKGLVGSVSHEEIQNACNQYFNTDQGKMLSNVISSFGVENFDKILSDTSNEVLLQDTITKSLSNMGLTKPVGKVLIEDVPDDLEPVE